MATIRFASAFNMLQAQDWDWEVTQNTATSLVVEDIAHARKQTFTGTFTYNMAGQVSGTCTMTTFFENGAIVYRISGMNHDAGALQAFAQASGDTQETYAFVLSGKDILVGSDGADTLLAYAGNDRIDGGAGADGMLGGAGDDIYIVDDVRDRVFETTTRASGVDAGGRDTVKASASFKLGDFVEKLTLTGSAAIDGTGNALANIIIGNTGANKLMGGGGADTLIAGAGDDTLGGGAGRDTLTGGTGEDTFDYNTVADSGASRLTWDIVKDFVSGEDKINLATIDANPFEAGNQAFMYAGSGEWGVGEQGVGRVRYEVLAGGVVVYGNVDMDDEPEFAIFLAGAEFVTAGDFVL